MDMYVKMNRESKVLVTRDFNQMEHYSEYSMKIYFRLPCSLAMYRSIYFFSYYFVFILIWENVMPQDTLLASYIKIDKKIVIDHKIILNQIKDSINNTLNFIHLLIFIIEKFKYFISWYNFYKVLDTFIRQQLYDMYAAGKRRRLQFYKDKVET